MPTVLDTNSLIRFFTNDIPDKAIKVKYLLEKEKNIYVPEVVFPEIEYILSEQYKVSKKNILKIFQFLASQKNIKISKEAKKAIAIFEDTNLDIADCLIASYSLKGKLASFDKELLKIQDVKPFWK